MDISIGRFKLVPKQQADGACWYFTSKQGQPQLGYFKFPPLQPHQVRIKIMYTSICHTDSTQIRKGWVPLPRTSGHQYVGSIEAIGQKVTTRKIGQIVAVGYKKGACGACAPCTKGLKQGCRSHPNNITNGPDVGGFSTHAYAEQDWTFQIPEGYQPQYAPSLMCAGITAYNPLVRHCKKGDKIGVVGIGGLGHLCLKFGKALGYDITAISTSADKQKDALEFGATSFLVSSDDNLKKNQRTFDVIIMLGNVPSQKFSDYLNLTKLGGKICSASIFDPNPKIAFYEFVLDQRQICGILIGDQEMVKDMLTLVAKQKIHPTIELTDFSNFKEALKKTEDYKARYRMVLKVPQNFIKQ